MKRRDIEKSCGGEMSRKRDKEEKQRKVAGKGNGGGSQRGPQQAVAVMNGAAKGLHLPALAPLG